MDVTERSAKTIPARETTSRDQLLEATSKILADRHSINVSFSEIAESSGLNSALIKYYFGSKDGLLLALVHRDASLALRKLDHLVGLNIPPEKKIRLHLAGVISTYTKYPYLNRLIHALLENESQHIPEEIANFFVKPLVDAQKKILGEGVAQGVFRPVDPMFFYYSIIGACDHLFYARVSLKSVFDIDEITLEIRESYINFVCDLTLRLLRKE
jgi:AcrR family transcriptional regulator